MQTTELGRTGVRVSAIGLGEMPMSLRDRPPEAESVKVIHRALALGVTFIDTADSYCLDEDDKHHGERLVARALREWDGDRDAIVVATKGGLTRHHGEWQVLGDPAHVARTIRESHAALGGDRPIDLWQHHAPDPSFTIEQSLEPVARAVQDGLIRFVGVSNYSTEQIDRARKLVDVVSVQNQHNPWVRKPERDGVLAHCDRLGLTFLPWSPLGGSRRVKRLDELPDLVAIAQAHDTSVYCVVLAWLMAKSDRVLPIPGASRASSIEDSVKALDVRLTPSDLARIDALEAT